MLWWLIEVYKSFSKGSFWKPFSDLCLKFIVPGLLERDIFEMVYFCDNTHAYAIICIDFGWLKLDWLENNTPNLLEDNSLNVEIVSLEMLLAKIKGANFNF